MYPEASYICFPVYDADCCDLCEGVSIEESLEWQQWFHPSPLVGQLTEAALHDAVVLLMSGSQSCIWPGSFLLSHTDASTVLISLLKYEWWKTLSEMLLRFESPHHDQSMSNPVLYWTKPRLPSDESWNHMPRAKARKVVHWDLPRWVDHPHMALKEGRPSCSASSLSSFVGKGLLGFRGSLIHGWSIATSETGPWIRNCASETRRASEAAHQKPPRIKNCASEAAAHQKLRIQCASDKCACQKLEFGSWRGAMGAGVVGGGHVNFHGPMHSDPGPSRASMAGLMHSDSKRGGGGGMITSMV